MKGHVWKEGIGTYIPSKRKGNKPQREVLIKNPLI